MIKLIKRFSFPVSLWIQKDEKSFLSFVIAAFMLAMFATPYPQIAMWVGFLFAAYAAVANDSIQTLGTFIASNQDKKWWVLWLFIGGIFVLTMSYSWFKIDETGITVFANKVSKDISKEERGLDFYANYTVEFNGEIIKGSSINIQKSSENEIRWSVESNNTIINKGILNPTSSYINEDYGLCFFVGKDNNIYEITNISKESDFKDIQNTFYKYTEIDFENEEGEIESHVISYKTNGKRDIAYEMYGDGVVDKDISHARLSSKGYEQTPRSFHYLQVAAAIFLLILTRLRMPVSTTFILLTSFAATPAAVGAVLAKSMSGYILAFLLGFTVFLSISKLAKKYFVGEAKFVWTIAQWITTGTLWSVWLMQDAANIAVYLPRRMGFSDFMGFVIVIFAGLGLLLYYKGGRIQKIVTEKSVITDVRFATIVDFIYCIILFYFKLYSSVPMSTTWVFIGLLGGREVAMAIRKAGDHSLGHSIKLLIKDFSYAMIGLFISIAIAIGVNDQLTLASMIETIPSEFSSGITKFFSRLGL